MFVCKINVINDFSNSLRSSLAKNTSTSSKNLVSKYLIDLICFSIVQRYIKFPKYGYFYWFFFSFKVHHKPQNNPQTTLHTGAFHRICHTPKSLNPTSKMIQSSQPVHFSFYSFNFRLFFEHLRFLKIIFNKLFPFDNRFLD